MKIDVNGCIYIKDSDLSKLQWDAQTPLDIMVDTEGSIRIKKCSLDECDKPHYITQHHRLRLSAEIIRDAGITKRTDLKYIIFKEAKDSEYTMLLRDPHYRDIPKRILYQEKNIGLNGTIYIPSRMLMYMNMGPNTPIKVRYNPLTDSIDITHPNRDYYSQGIVTKLNVDKKFHLPKTFSRLGFIRGLPVRYVLKQCKNHYMVSIEKQSAPSNYCVFCSRSDCAIVHEGKYICNDCVTKITNKALTDSIVCRVSR